MALTRYETSWLKLAIASAIVRVIAVLAYSLLVRACQTNSSHSADS